MSSMTIATWSGTHTSQAGGGEPPLRWQNKTGISQNALEILALLGLVASSLHTSNLEGIMNQSAFMSGLSARI